MRENGIFYIRIKIVGDKTKLGIEDYIRVGLMDMRERWGFIFF